MHLGESELLAFKTLFSDNPKNTYPTDATGVTVSWT